MVASYLSLSLSLSLISTTKLLSQLSRYWGDKWKNVK